MDHARCAQLHYIELWASLVERELPEGIVVEVLAAEALSPALQDFSKELGARQSLRIEELHADSSPLPIWLILASLRSSEPAATLREALSILEEPKSQAWDAPEWRALTLLLELGLTPAEALSAMARSLRSDQQPLAEALENAASAASSGSHPAVALAAQPALALCRSERLLLALSIDSGDLPASLKSLAQIAQRRARAISSASSNPTSLDPSSEPGSSAPNPTSSDALQRAMERSERRLQERSDRRPARSVEDFVKTISDKISHAASSAVEKIRQATAEPEPEPGRSFSISPRPENPGRSLESHHELTIRSVPTNKVELNPSRGLDPRPIRPTIDTTKRSSDLDLKALDSKNTESRITESLNQGPNIVIRGRNSERPATAHQPSKTFGPDWASSDLSREPEAPPEAARASLEITNRASGHNSDQDLDAFSAEESRILRLRAILLLIQEDPSQSSLAEHLREGLSQLREDLRGLGGPGPESLRRELDDIELAFGTWRIGRA